MPSTHLYLECETCRKQKAKDWGNTYTMKPGDPGYYRDYWAEVEAEEWVRERGTDRWFCSADCAIAYAANT